MKASALRQLRGALVMLERASNDSSKTDFEGTGALYWPIVVGSVRYSLASALNELGDPSALKRIDAEIEKARAQREALTLSDPQG